MNYTCPYCNQPTTITSPNYYEGWIEFNIDRSRLVYPERVGLRYQAIACPNQDCKEMSLTANLKQTVRDQYNRTSEGDRVLEHWQLLPESTAKHQPEYIPSPLVEDYREACRVKDLSPKSSAALARRCLQGMIRDYWGVTKPTLKKEIEALEEYVTEDVWQAIDAVRSVGNIGAHMEKDVNLIIDIDPDEADLLLNLIEDLFTDWYVVRHDRQMRQAKLKAIALEKQAVRGASTSAPTVVQNDKTS